MAGRRFFSRRHEYRQYVHCRRNNDYGPFEFLDNYNPNFICHHSDTSGRYSFKRQPAVGLWNYNALANALTSLLSPEQLITALKEYEPLFFDTLLELYRNKLGLLAPQLNDQDLIDELLAILESDKIDYNIFFRRLCFLGEKNGYKKFIRLIYSSR